MSIQVTWLSHSGFKLLIDGKTILIDPYLSQGAAKSTADTIDADFIILTHGHGDHSSDTPTIAKRTGATVIANFEVANWISAQGVEKTSGHNPGGGYDFGFGRVEFTHAIHSSSMPDGSYGGSACGIIIFGKEMTIYHSGDTCLFSDMKLIGEKGIDLAIIPIGDYYTMGIEDSVRAVQFIQPKYVMPAHYNTFPVLKQDGAAWAEKIRQASDAQPIVLEVDETYSF